MAARLGKNRRRVFANLRERYGDNCHWCGRPMDFDTREQPLSPSVEHLIPKSVGGTNKQGNLRLAHLHCNQARGEIKPTLLALKLSRALFA
jgi:5-methylcytosine-specific restriction endonuclease McrA